MPQDAPAGTGDTSLNLSDDSFTMLQGSPQQPRRSGTPGPRVVQGTRRPMTIRTQSSGLETRRSRPPSPAIERTAITSHELVAAQGEGAEAKLQALETQRVQDHAFLSNMVAAVKGL